MDNNIISSIKCLGIDMISEASSGHPGIVLSSAPIIYTLFNYHLNINPNDPTWINRDRFVLSAGHGSALLYSTLYMAGFNYTLDDLKSFRQINSITPGHPEYNPSLGIEMTTGPLGQGIASAVGMALSERTLSALVNKKDTNQKLIDHYTYVLCGDGDLMEGVSYEALSFAGTQKLNKLIVLYDSNDVTLDGNLSLSFNENIQLRFESMNFHYQITNDSVKNIDDCIKEAKMVTDRPSIIEVKTTLGKGSILEGTNKVHGKPLEDEDIKLLKNKLNMPQEKFFVNREYRNAFINQIKERVSVKYNEYLNYVSSLDNEYLKTINEYLKCDCPKISIDFKDFEIKEEEELRITNERIVNYISDRCPLFVGGSADLSSSNKTNLTSGTMSSSNPLGKNIYYGIREHAMGAISNGLTLSKIRNFNSTFLTFSDYLKPAIRISALMNIPSIYIFTHDSITIGEDGETHQPIEQLIALRSIPNLVVLRPSDVKELIGCWQIILKSNFPVALIISKNKLKKIKNSDENSVKFGAYIISAEQQKLDGIIISCGEELHTALELQKRLLAKNKDVRIISMPSIELYKLNDNNYVSHLFPLGVKKIVLEYSSSYSWYNFVYNDKYLINMNNFGKSGKKEDILNYFKLDIDSLEEKIIKLL